MIQVLAVAGLIVAMFIVRKQEEKPAFDKLQPVSLIPSPGVEFELDSAAKEEQDSAGDEKRTDEEAELSDL
jgi:hypothetical protein